MERFKDHTDINVRLVVTNNPEAGVIQRAEKMGVPVVVCDLEFRKSPEKMLGLMKKHEVNFIVLAGWLKLIPKFIVAAFQNAIVNVHPALLPKFGGKGMYGSHVHRAVSAANESKSGITIHYVNEAFDEGEIIAQFDVAIPAGADPEIIESQVRKLELKHYPEVIENVLLNR